MNSPAPSNTAQQQQRLEGIKRAREDYQMLLCSEPRPKAPRGDGGARATQPPWRPTGHGHGHGYGDSDSYAAQLSPLSGACTVFPPPSTVEVTRADTGRTCSFVFCPSVAYSWDRRGEFYRSLAGESVGYEMHETVRAAVAPAQPLGGRRPDDAQANEESSCDAAPPSGPPLASAPTAVFPGAGGGGEGYYFELSQTTRTLRPPPLASSFNAARTGEPPWYGVATPALVVDCLLKCAAEEAQLLDAPGWAFLYRGRHLHSEVGKEVLGWDLLGRERAAGPAAAPALISLCAIRKF